MADIGIDMIKNNQKYLNGLHVIIDALIITGSYMLAWWIKFETPLGNVKTGDFYLPMETYFGAIPYIVAAYLIIYRFCKLYTAKRGSGPGGELLRIMEANVLGAVGMTSVLFIIWQQHFSRSMIAMFVCFNIVLTSALIARRRGYNIKHVLLVGYSRAAEEYIDRVRSNPQWGYVVHAILDDVTPRGTLYKGIKVVGRIDNLKIILPENKLDEIAITLPLSQYSLHGRSDGAAGHQHQTRTSHQNEQQGGEALGRYCGCACGTDLVFAAHADHCDSGKSDQRRADHFCAGENRQT